MIVNRSCGEGQILKCLRSWIELQIIFWMSDVINKYDLLAKIDCSILFQALQLASGV